MPKPHKQLCLHSDQRSRLYFFFIRVLSLPLLLWFGPLSQPKPELSLAVNHWSDVIWCKLHSHRPHGLSGSLHGAPGMRWQNQVVNAANEQAEPEKEPDDAVAAHCYAFVEKLWLEKIFHKLWTWKIFLCRKEDRCGHGVKFIWLTSGFPPDRTCAWSMKEAKGSEKSLL